MQREEYRNGINSEGMVGKNKSTDAEPTEHKSSPNKTREQKVGAGRGMCVWLRFLSEAL